MGEIPSIPGGVLEIIEVNREFSTPHIERVNAKFGYLEETSYEGDLGFVRDVFTSSGLFPIE